MTLRTIVHRPPHRVRHIGVGDRGLIVMPGDLLAHAGRKDERAGSQSAER